MRDDARPTAGDKPSYPPGAWLPSCPNVRTHLVAGFTVVEFHGEIDLTTVPEIRAHMDAATWPVRPRVIVDLRPALFFDCSAVSLIYRARRRVLERNGTLAVVCASPWHLRVLNAVGMSASIPLAATVEDACAEALPEPDCATDATEPLPPAATVVTAT